MHDYKQLGENIRLRRKQLQISSEKLAEETETSIATISRIERGIINDLKLSTLLKIATFLETTPNTLLGLQSDLQFQTKYERLLKSLIKIDEIKRNQLINIFIDLALLERKN